MGEGDVGMSSVVVKSSGVVAFWVVVVRRDVVELGIAVVGTGGGLVPPWHSGTFCGKSQISKRVLK